MLVLSKHQSKIQKGEDDDDDIILFFIEEKLKLLLLLGQIIKYVINKQ